MTATEKSSARMRKIFEADAKRFDEANEERGDGWTCIGAIGLFFEVRTMYIRLRGALWARRELGWAEINKKGLYNILIDLRNYAAMLQMAIEDENMIGFGDDREL